MALVGALVVGCGLAVFLGATAAAWLSGGWVSGDPGTWVQVAAALVARPDEPAAAWGVHAGGLPGPALYWSATVVVMLGLVAGGALAVWGWVRLRSSGRTQFGVATDARVARRRDVGPLAVRTSVPPTGRLLLGRMAPRGPFLATEDRERYPTRGHAARRQGDRGSVALIGPTRSGKTVLASAGIVAWDGPVVALSVKRDLFDATASARSRRGELAVFDPGGVTKLSSARWTPLRDVTTASGALRAGRALAQAIPRNGVQGGDFWAQHGETFIGAYMSLAGLSQLLPAEDGSAREPLTMQRLATWAYMQVGITEPAVHELVRVGLSDGQPLEVQLLARNAATKLLALHHEDPRIRGSIYATARLAFESWTEPSVAHSASDDPRPAYDSDELWEWRPRCLDLEWLMGGGSGEANTLYLAAPDTEFARLAPVLGGLLGDLREQIHAWDIEGRRLTKPLLFVIDEAGQLELQWLPAEVSTIAGLGAMFVTCWQSRAQINHRYGTLADAVLGGHRSKVVFNGTDDPSTLEYLSRVAGTEHVPWRGWSAETGGGRRTVSEQLQREDLLPAHVIRQMRRQEAVLLHGTLPPIHLRAVLWWEDTELASLVDTDGSGRPVVPDVSTCPLTDLPSEVPGPVLDPNSVQDPTRRLPRPTSPAPDPNRSGTLPRPATTSGHSASRPAADAGAGRSSSGSQLRLVPFDTADLPDEAPSATDDGADPADGVERNRVAGACARCGRWLRPGDGEAVRFGTREVFRCHPSCR